MNTQAISVGGCNPQTIVIGRRGTYNTQEITFDLSYLIDTYGAGVAALMVMRSQDTAAYPAVVSQEDTTLTWTVSEIDTYYVGSGEVQLMWYVDGGLAKTVIFPMVVMRDILQTTEEPPDAYETWVDDLTALGAETLQNAQDAAQSASEAEQSATDAGAAKTAAENAQTAAETAQGLAEDAKTAAETAQGKAETAQGKAETAQEKAETAQTAAEAAADRAEDALEEFTTPTASATTLDPDDDATASYANGHFTFGIPKGDVGSTPDFSIGSVETLQPSQPATASITGTLENPVLNLGIPQGKQGDPATNLVQSVNGKTGAVVLDSGDIAYESTTVEDELGTLNSALSSIDEELETVEDAISESEDRGTFFTFYKNGIKDIVLNGQATGVYDGCALIDGVNVKVTSLNGQTTDCNLFFLSNQVNKANGADNFISDILPVKISNNQERIFGREANSSLEICLLKTRCEYSVDAVNEYLKAHPIRVWFKTPNFSTASSFYYYLNCIKTGYYLNIGTTQALPQLSTGDTLSFGTGKYSIGGSTGTVSISGDIFSIEDGATVSSSGNLSTKELADLQSRFDEKVSKDGWNEVLPINTTFFDGVNYFDLSKAIVYNDRFVNGSGKVAGAVDVTSVVCPVKPSTTYWFYATGMNRFFVVENDSATFNINSSYTVLHDQSETDPTSITTGATARYVCIYFANYTYDFTQNNPILNEKLYNGTNNPYVAEDYLPKAVTNPLRNANVLIFGDSITDSCNITVNANDETTAYTWKNPSNSYTDAGGNIVRFNMWPFMLKNLGVFSEIRNYARSGASYRDATRTAGEERQNLSYQITVALNDLDNPNGVFDVDEFVPDIVIFALGTNDGAPNDTYQDAMAKTVLKSDGYSIDTDATLANLDRSKFCEAARSAFLRTRIAFPEAQFYCVLPIQKANDEVNGQNLNTYLREMARRYGCVIIDGYAESGIIRDTNVWNALGATLKDGLHPNDKGQNMMFRMIYSALKSHYIKDDVMN